jgi:hypothetical protein
MFLLRSPFKLIFTHKILFENVVLEDAAIQKLYVPYSKLGQRPLLDIINVD